MLKPLELCLNSVNNDVSYLTGYDDATGVPTEPVRLTKEQYDQIQAAVWAAVETILPSVLGAEPTEVVEEGKPAEEPQEGQEG